MQNVKGAYTFMTPRQPILLTLAFGLLAAATGCKDPPQSELRSSVAGSQTSPPATPSPRPVVKLILPRANAMPPPPLTSLVPVKTFRVLPPASFNGDQLPKGGAVEFQMHGRAGQFLMLKVGAGEIYRVLMQPPTAGSAPLRPGWDSGKWLYALPQTGTYRVLYAPTASSDIEFAFLADNDPITDPGINPEQISIEFGQFAHDQHLRVLPYALNDGEDYPDSWPTHLGVETKRFEFRIMTVAGYKKIFHDHREMDALEDALRAGREKSNRKGLPYSVYLDGGLNWLGRQEFLKGEGWRGLRWIGDFAQDYSCTLNLAYLFEGISNDGRFFILIRAAIANPSVAQRFSEECEAAVGESDSPQMARLFDRDMVAADSTSFEPVLNRLDAVILSLRIKQ